VPQVEEDQQLIDGKLSDLYQTKVESGSKYRLRLSGVVLLNMYDNRGTVEYQDIPSIAEPPQTEPLFVSPSSFGGTLRQSQIRLQAFGPDISGARTARTCNLILPAGSRIHRTASAWPRASAHGDDPTGLGAYFDCRRAGPTIFAPLAPTSLATLAAPALSYAGNLWAWAPASPHRTSHRFVRGFKFLVPGRNSRFTVGGLSGQFLYPLSGVGRNVGPARLCGPGFLESSRVRAELHRRDGRVLWPSELGFSRNVDGWAGTTDVTLPLGKLFEFTGEFYRGRAVAGLGGGIGQGILFAGSFTDPATTFKGLDSMGGWAQLKVKPR